MLEWFENNPLNWLNCTKFVCRNVTVIIEIDLDFNVGLNSSEGLKRELLSPYLEEDGDDGEEEDGLTWCGHDDDWTVLKIDR